jgi:hypothetical protein
MRPIRARSYQRQRTRKKVNYFLCQTRRIQDCPRHPLHPGTLLLSLLLSHQSGSDKLASFDDLQLGNSRHHTHTTHTTHTTHHHTHTTSVSRYQQLTSICPGIESLQKLAVVPAFNAIQNGGIGRGGAIVLLPNLCV